MPENKFYQMLLEIRNSIRYQKMLWTIEEFCAYTGWSKSWVHKLTSGRQVPHVKKGKTLFFEKNIIESWLRDNPISTQKAVEFEALQGNKKKRKG